MSFRAIKTGVAAGAVYAVIVLIIEDFVALWFLREEFTFRQVVSSFFIYEAMYIALGLLTGFWYSLFASKRDKLKSPAAYVTGYLTILTVFICGLEVLPETVLSRSLKFQAVIVLVWLISLGILRFLTNRLCKTGKNISGAKYTARITGISAGATVFCIIFLKIYSSPFASSAVNSSGILWIAAGLLVSAGFYLLGRELSWVLHHSGTAARGSKTILFILAFLLILIPAIITQSSYRSYVSGDFPDKNDVKIDYPNVIFVVIDALRADFTGVYGSDLNVTPNIDKYAEKGVVFANTLAASSWTKPSVAAYFTSRYPGMNAVEEFADLLPSDLTTIAEVLKEQGYYTKSVVTNINASQHYNYQQGFDSFLYLSGHGLKQLLFPLKFLTQKIPILEELAYRIGLAGGNRLYGDAYSVNHAAIPWMKKCGSGPFFLYLHYMEPHFPYHPRTPMHSRGQKLTMRDLRAFRDMRDPDSQTRMSEETINTLRNRYSDEIFGVDEKIGELFTFFDEHHVWDNSIVILTSDHGEEFFEHGMGDHGNSMYQELLEVPLMIFLPGTDASHKTVSEPAYLLDLPPTIYDYLGIVPGYHLEGRSLRPLIEGQEPAETPLYFGEVKPFREIHPADKIYALIEGDYKLIRSIPKSAPENRLTGLYNLTDDPGELIDVSAEFPEIMLRLSAMMDSLIDYNSVHKVEPMELDDSEISQKQKDHLRALGYAK